MSTLAHLGQRAMSELELLTPGGSEFIADPERCVAYVRERFSTGDKAKKDRARLRREHNEIHAALNERIEWLEEALVERTVERDSAVYLLILAMKVIA